MAKLIKLPDNWQAMEFKPEAFTKKGTRFEASEKGDTPTIYLFDEIGYWGVDAASFIDMFAQYKNESALTLKINSPGGSVFEGFTIYNELAQFKGDLTVEVVGMAASIASVIAMAGDKIKISNNGRVMIHNASTFAYGNKFAMQELYDWLDSIDGDMIDIYASKTGGDRKQIENWLDAETWFKGQKAVDAGFADEVTSKDNARAFFDLSRFKNAPDDGPDADFDSTPTLRDCERALKNIGLPAKVAASMTARYRSERDSDRTETDRADFLKNAISAFRQN